MDCDRAFATLTRGPFPTGTPIDAEVERHLESCESCRAIAIALAPNDEGATNRHAERLPSYRGAATPRLATAATRARQQPATAWPAALAADDGMGCARTPAVPQLASMTLTNRVEARQDRFFRFVGASAAALVGAAILAMLA